MISELNATLKCLHQLVENQSDNGDENEEKLMKLIDPLGEALKKYEEKVYLIQNTENDISKQDAIFENFSDEEKEVIKITGFILLNVKKLKLSRLSLTNLEKSLIGFILRRFGEK
jgi:hypothetical protein